MNESYFTKRIFYRFFLPAVVSSACLGVANLADALCVGMRLGEPALAAISLVSPVYMVFNLLDVGIAVGGSLVFVRLVGEGRAKKAENVFHQMFITALFVSVLLSVIGLLFLEPLLVILGASPDQGAVYEMTKTYTVRLVAAAPLFFLNQLFYHFIRCDNGEKRAGIGLLTANILDVGLSFLFVLQFNMGIKGAIWATIIGTSTGVLIYLPHFFIKRNILNMNIKKPEFGVILKCYKIGLSSSLQFLSQFAVLIIMNNLLMRRHGEGALAVLNVVLNVSYVLLGLYEGVGITLQPLAATFYSERNHAAKRQSLKLSFCWVVIMGAAGAGLVFVYAKEIARVFGLSESMLGMGELALRYYCLSSLFIGVSMTLCGYWQAVEKEKDTLILNFLRSFAVYLPVAVVLVWKPLDWFWIVFPITEILSLLLFFLWKGLHFSRVQNMSFGSLDGTPILQQILVHDVEALGGLLEKVDSFCDEQGAAAGQTFLVTMAVEEMCQAIFLHASKRSRRELFIQITLFPIEKGMFELHVRDNGKEFDPFSLYAKRISETESEEQVMDGIGVLMVKAKAKEFYYRYYQGFNTLTVRI